MRIQFTPARNGGVMAKVDGIVSFPERRGPQPQAGEVWEVEITGQNATGKVNFLRCIKNISALIDENASRIAAILDAAGVQYSRYDETFEKRFSNSEIVLAYASEYDDSAKQAEAFIEKYNSIRDKLEKRAASQAEWMAKSKASQAARDAAFIAAHPEFVGVTVAADIKQRVGHVDTYQPYVFAEVSVPDHPNVWLRKDDAASREELMAAYGEYVKFTYFNPGPDAGEQRFFED